MLDLEKAVLGSIFIDNSVMDKISWLEVEDFMSHEGKTLFGVVKELFNERVAIDFVTVGARLQKTNSLKSVGGTAGLSSLTDSVATAANVEHYANELREKSTIRKAGIEAENLVQVIKGKNVTTEDVVSAIDLLRSRASSLSGRRDPASMMDLGMGVVEAYNLVKRGFQGIPFPWESVSTMTLGMWPKTMTIFVARPGLGKTTLAILIARHAWKLGKRVLIVSPEMSKAEIAERFFVTESGVSYAAVIHGNLTEFELVKLCKSIDEAKDKRWLWIMDATDDITPRGIESAVNSVNAELVVIDAMYMIRTKGTRVEKVEQALSWLGDACKRMNFAACCTSQLNRTSEMTEKHGGGVRLGTIALSDQMGWDVHAVFALVQDADMKSNARMKIVPLKLRRGEWSGPVEIRWDFRKMDFSEIPVVEQKYEDDAGKVPY